MDLDLRLVRYAVTLADELHYARAAARLHIAQQTLSAQINQLEARLGVTLFVRDRRHVELTSLGEVFVRRGRALLTGAADLVAELQGSEPPLRVDVITEGLTAGVVARELRSKLPGVTLEILQGQGLTAAVPAVTEGRIDLAFGYVQGVELRWPSSLSHQLVRWEPVGIVLPADHPLAEREQVRLKDLAGSPLVLHTAVEAPEWRAWNEEVATVFGIPVGWRQHGHGRASANTAVLAHRSPAFGPLDAPLLNGVVVRQLVDPVPLAPISVVWRSEGGTPDRVRRATTAIRQIASAHGWLVRPTAGHWVPAAADRRGTAIPAGGA